MKKNKKQYTIEVEADPITVDLDEFKENDILDYVEDVLGYFVSKNTSAPLSVLDEVTEQLKDEFFEGLDFHQLNRLIRNKNIIVELLAVLP
jgi:hypothetical protein